MMIKPHKFQKPYINEIVKTKNLTSPIPMGCGKDIILLESITKLQMKSLVIAPLMLHSLINHTIHRYYPHISFVELTGKYSLLALDYALSKHLRYESITVINEEKLKWLSENTNNFENFPWEIVFTWSIRAKNPNSKVAERLRVIFSKAKHRINLSNNPLFYPSPPLLYK